MQTMARKNGWPLDKMSLTVDVTKKTKEDYGHPPREGAYLHGLVLEGTLPRGAHVGLVPGGPFLNLAWHLPLFTPLLSSHFSLVLAYLIS